MSEDSLVMICFPLSEEDRHATERLWAKEMGPGLYQIRNTPFYVYGVSFEDVIRTHRDESGQLLFAGVSDRSGHSTYRLKPKVGIGAEEFGVYWRPLEAIGCSYEEGTGNLLAVDVPSRADIRAAYSMLEKGEEAEVWEFEEGHCGHPLPS